MSGIPSSSSVSEMNLPEGFESLVEIEGMDVERLQTWPLVNVIGVVSSILPPTATNGTDWKYTAVIVDTTTSLRMEVVFFSSREMLPQIDGPGAVLKLDKIKVQMRHGRVSLLTNRVTKYCVVPGVDLQNAFLQPKIVKTLALKYQMSSKEMSYAIWLRANIQNSLVPSTQKFQAQAEQAICAKDKYSPLKDLKADKYYNLLGEIIHIYEHNDRMTVYLSDYTAHSLFYDCKNNGGQTESSGRDGDEYGYTNSFTKSNGKNWPGPYGKLTIQLTLFDEHVQEMKKFEVGQWIFLRNIHVQMGNDSVHLEGRLHGARGGISIVRKSECSEENEERYEEGLRNKKAYEEKFGKQQQQQQNATGGGGKSMSKAQKKKLKKKEKAAAEKKIAELAEKMVEPLDLNKYIKCNNPDQPAQPLSYGLNPAVYVLQHDLGPDHVRRFRAHVRVIDFFPDKLEDFTSYDESENKWSWAFSLRVEDGGVVKNPDPSSNPSSKPRPWLLVDNSSAEFLLGLDADNLRRNDELLEQARLQLTTLWGDLEEKKIAVLERVNQIESTQSTKRNQSTKDDVEAQTLTKTNGSKRKRMYSPRSERDEDGMPPLYSDDENDSIEKAARSKRRSQPVTTRDDNEQLINLPMQQTKESILAEFERDSQAKNRVFTCCIREYKSPNNTERALAMIETKIAG